MAARYLPAHWLVTAALGRTASEMAAPGLLLVALANGRSVVQASWMLAAFVGSAAVAGPAVGVVLDRARRTAAMLSGAMICMAGCFLVLVIAMPAWPLWSLCLTATAAGLGAPVLSGGWTAQLPRMVKPAELPRALALDAGSYNAAGIMGPAIVAALAMTLTPQLPVLSAAVLLVVCALAALRIPFEAVAAREHRRVLVDLRCGLSALWSTRALRQVVVVSTIAHAGFGAFVVATPLMAQRWTGHAEAGAVLLTVYASGALASTVVLARRPIRHSPERVVVWAAAAVGLCLSLAAWSPNIVVATVLYTVAGVADGPLLVGTFAVRHRDAPVSVRSQVFTTAASLKIGAYAGGVAAAGMLSGGGVELLVLAGALHLCAAATSVRGPRGSGRSAVSLLRPTLAMTLDRDRSANESQTRTSGRPEPYAEGNGYGAGPIAIDRNQQLS